MSLGIDLDVAPPAAASGDVLEAVAAHVRRVFTPDRDPWEHSPYRWIKDLAPARRSKAGALIVEYWLRAAGLDPSKVRGQSADMTVTGHNVTVKLSTLWETGQYHFQAVTGSAPTLALVGVRPDGLDLWLLPTATAAGHLDHGKAGWVTIDAARPAAWVEDHRATAALARAYLGGPA